MWICTSYFFLGWKRQFVISIVLKAHPRTKTIIFFFYSLSISLHSHLGEGKEEGEEQEMMNMFSEKNIYGYPKHGRELEDSGAVLKTVGFGICLF